MDSQENTQGQAQSNQQGSTQNAQADLQQVANRAKAATAGFSIEKLFQGRIDNVNYFYFAVISIVGNYVFGHIPLIGSILSLALSVLGIGMAIRRFHDIGKSGWYSLVFFAPMLGVLGGGSMAMMNNSIAGFVGMLGLVGLLGLLSLLVMVYLCWIKGNAGANMYGEAPDPKREFFRAVLNT